MCQDEYEADRLRAEPYETRVALLDEELATLYLRVAAFESQTDVTELQLVPSEVELAALRASRASAYAKAACLSANALFEALAESIEVHRSDDIPTHVPALDPRWPEH